MKVSHEFHNLTSPRACSNRHVLLLETGWEDLQPSTMEEIRISIPNDRAIGTKHKREDTAEASPSNKKLRSSVFSCSTPCSASHRSKHTQHIDEFDDSLLELSDNESDSPLYLTIDEIDTLLEDESCYAAEPPVSDDDKEEMFGSLESKADGVQRIPSLCQLDSSHTLTEEAESTEETSIYAAMVPSPCHSTISSAEQAVMPGDSASKHYAIISSRFDSAQIKVTMDSGSDVTVSCRGLTKSGSDMERDPVCHSPRACSANDMLPKSQPLLGLDDLDGYSEGSDIAFDCDIDELLILSPVDTLSAEEEEKVRVNTISSKITSGTSDTIPALLQHTSAQFLVTPSAAISESKNSVQHPLLTSAISSGPTDILQLPASDISEPRDSTELPPLLSAASPGPSLDNAAGSLNSEGQEVEHSVHKVVRETEAEQGARSSKPVIDSSVSKSVEHKSVEQKQSQVTATIRDEKSAPSQNKNLKTVSSRPRPAFRPMILPEELENNKNNYCGSVIMHLESPSTTQAPYFELASLLNQTSRDHPNWQHPSDFTRRNYCVKNQPARCSLNQWVTMNGGNRQRFQDVPVTFQRSPLPNVLSSRPV
ncbi:S100P-binding protein [Rhinophrynus dorsalis]